MTLQGFKNKASKFEFNTNNAWGFGGSFGTKYTVNDLTYIERQICYRHTGRTGVEEYFKHGNEINKQDFLNIIKDL